ncbi:MAG: hypothetical protein LBO02_03675 [Holosporaceae bacterium]|nr:hypothetical protein [Holosporaceae bacterium]
MKVVSCFCFALCVSSALAEDAGATPKIYSDISESAQEDAVSFDGIRGFLGLNFLSQRFDASVGNSNNFTENKMNLFGLCLGMEYAKAFRKGFLVAIDVGVDVSKKNKKEGNWSALNEQFEAQQGPFHWGNRTGRFEKDLICPRVALRGGYLIPSYKSMIFVKLGICRISGVYLYEVNGVKVCNVDVGVYVPSLGLGIERKINRKWGASLEANWSMKKVSKGVYDMSEHKIKVGNRDIRLMGIYSISHDK